MPFPRMLLQLDAGQDLSWSLHGFGFGGGHNSWLQAGFSSVEPQLYSSPIPFLPPFTWTSSCQGLGLDPSLNK